MKHLFSAIFLTNSIQFYFCGVLIFHIKDSLKSKKKNTLSKIKYSVGEAKWRGWMKIGVHSIELMNFWAVPFDHLVLLGRTETIWHQVHRWNAWNEAAFQYGFMTCESRIRSMKRSVKYFLSNKQRNKP